MKRLAAGELCAIFTVDVFNEGVDIPSVDTVLFLRPTESATLYLQQLGRGLRLHEDKSCLTVLDFIGRANRSFRFDRRFRALMGGGTRAEVHGGARSRGSSSHPSFGVEIARPPVGSRARCRPRSSLRYTADGSLLQSSDAGIR